MNKTIIEVLDEMAEYLSIEQLKKLQQVMVDHFAENVGEVLAELESLRDQLEGLAEMERFSIGNIL